MGKGENIVTDEKFFWTRKSSQLCIFYEGNNGSASASAEFYWDEKLQELFEEVREEVDQKVEAGVKMLDMDRITDWLKEGVGFFMLQKYCNCQDIKTGCC